MDGKREVCCVCGRELPNRWAVAGRCVADGCGAAFCALHWHNGNGKCPEHGCKTGEKEKIKMNDRTEGRASCTEAGLALSPERNASVLRQIGSFVVGLGKSAGALAKKLGGFKSTDEALREIEAQIAENRARREPVAKRYDELYKFIVAKKKLYQSAPPARKKILEMELKGLLAEYQSLERQMSAYLNNETLLVKVRGRMCELVAMNLKNISEDQIDKLTDQIEVAADDNENLDGAIDDLDKAGVRREREDASFEDALAAFGDDVPDVAPETAMPATPASGQAEEAKQGLPLADF